MLNIILKASMLKNLPILGHSEQQMQQVNIQLNQQTRYSNLSSLLLVV
jgi:hypothetical protein